MNKFKKGQIVIYKNGNRYELGEIEAVLDGYYTHQWSGEIIGYFYYDKEVEAIIILGVYDEEIGRLYSHEMNEFLKSLIRDKTTNNLNKDNLTSDEIMSIFDNCEEYKCYKNDARYRVWYHTGDTTALTVEEFLYGIENEYAFDIKRKTLE